MLPLFMRDTLHTDLGKVSRSEPNEQLNPVFDIIVALKLYVPDVLNADTEAFQIVLNLKRNGSYSNQRLG